MRVQKPSFSRSAIAVTTNCLQHIARWARPSSDGNTRPYFSVKYISAPNTLSAVRVIMPRGLPVSLATPSTDELAAARRLPCLTLGESHRPGLCFFRAGCLAVDHTTWSNKIKQLDATTADTVADRSSRTRSSVIVPLSGAWLMTLPQALSEARHGLA